MKNIAKSSPIGRRLFKAQEKKCFFCGEDISCKPLSQDDFGYTIDHLFPKSKGGPDNWGNKVFSCRPCNTRKGDSLPTKEDLRYFEQLRGKPANHIRKLLETVK